MRPLVMGILNVTPDSFSDGGRFTDVQAAVDHGLELVRQGADLVDVGGESTRPGAAPVGEAEELERVLPVISALSPHVRVSVDTSKAAVARAAVGAGASLINDVSASLHPVAAELEVAWLAMHMQGEPRSMQEAPRYDDVVADVRDHLVIRAEAALAAGVPEVWVDPGIGFGKSYDHNWALLRRLDVLCAAGFPVAVGTSRKAFLGDALAAADGAGGPVGVGDRLEGSVATAVRAAAAGASAVRVHDVAATVAAFAGCGLADRTPVPRSGTGSDVADLNQEADLSWQ